MCLSKLKLCRLFYLDLDGFPRLKDYVQREFCPNVGKKDFVAELFVQQHVPDFNLDTHIENECKYTDKQTDRWGGGQKDR